ncbi:MAG: ABC transporter substrate-binding protein, partial [Acetanaerobacterium sp.]
MKIFTKKIMALAVAALMLAGSLAGCSSKGEDPSDNASGNQPQDMQVKEIRVWTDNAHEKDLRLQQIEEFNNTTGKEKGVEIEYTVYGTNFNDALRIAAQADEAPELYRPVGAFLLDFVNAGYLVPITDLAGGEEYVEQYGGQLVNNMNVFDGKVYTLPYNLTTYKFAVNDDLFAKAGIAEYPKTWDDVRADAKLITEAGNGVEYGYALGLQSGWTMYSGLIRPNENNTGHMGFNHETMQFDFSAFAPVIEATYGMMRDGSVFPGPEGLDADAERAQFAEGRVGMIWTVSFDVGVYNDQFPAKCNWSVIPVPAFTDEGTPYKEIVDATALLCV